MQFMSRAIVGVLIALHLSTDCCCYYISTSNRLPTPAKSNPTTDRVQICGGPLTEFVIQICEGNVVSLGQESETTDSNQGRKLTDCCYQGCTLDYMLKFCGEKNRRQGNSVSKERVSSSGKMSQSEQGANGRSVDRGRTRGQSEVRVRGGTNGNRKKRKRSFKRKCAYKSFGHYLLKLSREDGSKVRNNINRSWPPIQIGTVSPEMEKFGGQPIVFMKKNSSNSVSVGEEMVQWFGGSEGELKVRKD